MTSNRTATPRRSACILIPLILLLTDHSMLHAESPMLFISSFAAGERGAIHTARLDLESGSLKLLEQSADVDNPFFLAVSPDGRFLYAIDSEKFADEHDEFIASFAIDARTGKLTKQNRASSRGRTSCYLDVDSTGKTVVVANYSSGDIAALPIGADGSVGDAASYIKHAGSSIDPARQKAPFAHCLEISPDNRFALAADLGIDKVLVYRLDAATAQLTPNEAQPFVSIEPGSGPRHLTFHPDGNRVFVINELKNTIGSFGYQADSGVLTHYQTISTLPADFDGTSYCADLKVTPDGRFLYGTNRGHDSIAMFHIRDDGELQRIGIEPSRGKGPQNLLISADGRWLLCANMPGNSVAVFRIDPQSGRLTLVGEPVEVTSPSCLRWLPTKK